MNFISLISMCLALASIGICETVDTEQQQDGELVFIGKGSTKLYFTLLLTYGQSWMEGFSYCHFRGFMPASIQTEADHLLVTTFLNSSNAIPIENKSFLLAATDHMIEGQYQWLVNRDEIKVGKWATGMPSGNTSLNCLGINSQGEWFEESCTGSKIHYYLCETPFKLSPSFPISNDMSSPPMYGIVPKEAPPAVNSANIAISSPSKHIPIPRQLIPIGSVGNKLYYLNDEELMSFMEGLDYCHEAGMRLASPETQLELSFIVDYMRQNAMNPVLAVWDALSLSCLQSNAEYRWFYSGNVVNRTDPDLNYHGQWYNCILLTINEFRTYSCTGFAASVICEMSPITGAIGTFLKMMLSQINVMR